jgi:integrase
VFTDGLGVEVRPDNFGRAVKRITKAAGREVNPHALRHSAATLLAASGVQIKTAQVILGHSSVSMTADVYTHVLGDDLTAAADALDAALGAG